MARAVRREGLAVQVGGPCTPVGYLYYGGYEGQWKMMLKPFIDAVGRDVDFISFHIYDYYTGTQGEILSGLPLENAFDLYEGYTFHTLGAVKPFACSEHGATGGNLNVINRPELAAEPGFKGIPTPRPLGEWIHLNSINGQIMSFLERPTMILKTVPFILDRADAWNPLYLYVLYAREGFAKTGPLRRTAMFQFYELWKDVRGERIEAHCDDPDVMACALSDGASVFLCLKNLAAVPKPVRLKSSTTPGSTSISRCHFADGAPRLERDVPLGDLDKFEMQADETAIVKLTFPTPVMFSGAVNERKFYANDFAVPIRAGKPHRYRIVTPATARYATLRIGISRPQTAVRTPVVLFNGEPLVVPMEAAAQARESSHDYATTKLIRVPAEALRADNEISVTFPDDGGAIGSVVLTLGEEKQL
jgi:hypothetical protein